MRLANDYFVSPAIALEAGKKYKLSANTMLRNEDSNMQLSFVYGTSLTDAATYTEVGSIASGITYDAARADETTFSVPATGNYYLGILGKSPESATTLDDWKKSQAAIFNFAVEEVVLPEDTVSLPYSVTFNVDNVGTWKSYNYAENSKAHKWGWDAVGYQEKDIDGNNVGDPHPGVRITTDDENAVCAFFYSPAMSLKRASPIRCRSRCALRRLTRWRCSMSTPRTARRLILQPSTTTMKSRQLFSQGLCIYGGNQQGRHLLFRREGADMVGRQRS